MQDSGGAAIPSAEVHVVNTATGVANDTKSNGVGFYAIPGLFTGTYTITFASPGMKKFQQTIDLQNGKSRGSQSQTERRERY